MKAGKHLKFYYDCMEEGEMPVDGLCICASCELIDMKMIKLFEPPENSKEHGMGYWASFYSDVGYNTFNPLRQTIVLFMAAMNNEL